MRKKSWWIKERHIPRTGVYFVCLGQISKKEAKKHEDPLYGYSYMFMYDTEQAYNEAISILKERGEQIYS